MIGDKEAEDILASLGEWDDQNADYLTSTQEELSSELVEDTPGDVADSGEEEEEDIFELLSEVARMKASLAPQGDTDTAPSTASTEQEVITCEDKTVFSISPAEMQQWEVHSASVDEAKVDAEIEAERIKAAATANEDADNTSSSSSSSG